MSGVAPDPLDRARTKIVAALNLTPLVPPQADTETLNVVDDAWSALSALVEVARAARDVLDYENAPSRKSLSYLRSALARLHKDTT